jgi:hypothetical protein
LKLSKLLEASNIRLIPNFGKSLKMHNSIMIPVKVIIDGEEIPNQRQFNFHFEPTLTIDFFKTFKFGHHFPNSKLKYNVSKFNPSNKTILIHNEYSYFNIEFTTTSLGDIMILNIQGVRK